VQAWDGSVPTATTTATANVYRAYQKLNDWETQSENSIIDPSVDQLVNIGKDLVASNTTMFVPCYASTSVDNLVFAIDSWTTATNSFVKIYTPVGLSEVGTSQRHNGKWSTAGYRLETNAKWDPAIDINVNYSRIEGLQVANIYSVGDGNPVGLDYVNVPGAGHHYIYDSIIKGASNYTTASRGINSPSGMKAGETMYIKNNIIYDWGSQCVFLHSGSALAWNVYIYNNTIVNCGNDADEAGIALQRPDGTVKLKNNLVQNTTSKYNYSFSSFGGNVITEYVDNISEDDTSPNDEHDYKTVIFEDSTNNDFHLHKSDSNARDQGINLSNDANLSFVTDIDGDIRSNLWDIGADEVMPKPEFRFSPGGTFKFDGTFKFE
jgi:hypothetical protein